LLEKFGAGKEKYWKRLQKKYKLWNIPHPAEVVGNVHNEPTFTATTLAHTSAGLCTNNMRQFCQSILVPA